MFSTLTLENKIVYTAGLKSSGYAVYWIFMLFVVSALIFLPFLYFDITIRSAGIIRPLNERTEVKSLQTGIIDTMFYFNGETIPKDSIIFRLKDNFSLPKKIVNTYELEQICQFIHDLEILTTNNKTSKKTFNVLQSPVYKQQISRFIYQTEEQESTIRKIKREIDINKILIMDRVIAPKEKFDKEMEYEKSKAAYNAFKNEQISIWQQQLSKYRVERAQLELQQARILEEVDSYIVRAPVSGVILGINSRYPGSLIEAGESFCIISPESDLIAECYVPTQDVGLLKIDQQAKFQVDAFDYNFFGILTGKILSIDNDFTLLESKPVFKVRCIIDSSQLYLKNGFRGILKKGLTLQARFIVARRSAWQLVFDKLDDWLNPESPKNN
jgi:multidrug efflux pump subunit AcrA (membrane-fusion protein)